MSKSLIIGDIHLGRSQSMGKPGIGSAYNSRIIDQKRILEWIIDVCRDRHVDRIFLTGDIFEETKPDYSLVKLLIDWLKAIEVENIDVYIIAGNHDLKRSGGMYTSVLDIISSCDFDRIFVYKNITTIQTPGAGFTLLPYRDRRGLSAPTNAEGLAMISESLVYEAASIPILDTKVLIGHLALEGSIYSDEIDDLLNELICPLKMFYEYDYVWMGHVHKPQVRSRHPHIAHIGSLDLSDFGEFDQQKILILFDSTKEDEEKFEYINIPSRPLRKLKINVPEKQNSTEFVITEINSNNEYYPYKNAIVRLDVILNGEDAIPLRKDDIEKHIYDLGAYYICGFSESKNISVVPLEKRDLIDNTVKVESAIKLWSNIQKFADEAEQNEFVALASDIVIEVNSNIK
jgi:exonuclease SbcD